MLGIFTRLGSISVPGSGGMVDKRVGRVRRVRFHSVGSVWVDAAEVQIENNTFPKFDHITMIEILLYSKRPF